MTPPRPIYCHCCENPMDDWNAFSTSDPLCGGCASHPRLLAAYISGQVRKAVTAAVSAVTIVHPTAPIIPATAEI